MAEKHFLMTKRMMWFKNKHAKETCGIHHHLSLIFSYLSLGCHVAFLSVTTSKIYPTQAVSVCNLYITPCEYNNFAEVTEEFNTCSSINSLKLA